MVRRPRSSNPTLVLLVRHGRTPTTGSILPGRAKGLNLSDEGKAEAEAVAERIAAAFPKVAAIYASPLERTRQTAAPIAKALGLSTQTHRGLLECEFGDWTGSKIKDLAKLSEWQTVQDNPSSFRFPGGESFLEMQARIGDAISRLVDVHSGATVVMVSHADPIKTAVATALGTPLDLFQRISISPCSVTAISYEARPHVLTVNDTGNLGALRPS